MWKVDVGSEKVEGKKERGAGSFAGGKFAHAYKNPKQVR